MHILKGKLQFLEISKWLVIIKIDTFYSNFIS
jgi:hypothetical protein